MHGSEPWRALGLKYPTSPIDNPHFAPWIDTLKPVLEHQETLVDFGFANEVGLLAAQPSTPAGEGFFAVTTHRSMFAYEEARRESPSEILALDISHSRVRECWAEEGWGDPATGAVYTASTAPSPEAILEIQGMGFPEMAIVHLAWEAEGAERRASFVTGKSGGSNWAALVKRFREGLELPGEWRPPRLAD